MPVEYICVVYLLWRSEMGVPRSVVNFDESGDPGLWTGEAVRLSPC